MTTSSAFVSTVSIRSIPRRLIAIGIAVLVVALIHYEAFRTMQGMLEETGYVPVGHPHNADSQGNGLVACRNLPHGCQGSCQ